MHENNDFIENLERLSSATWAYAALAAALELGMLDRLAEPVHERDLPELCGVEAELAADIVEALIAIGAIRRAGGMLEPAPSFEMLLSPSLARVLRAEIRGDHLQTRGLVHRAREGEPVCGWRLEDPVALTAQGETGGLIGLLVEALLPGLAGLDERMRNPGARILDVGAGVGVVSIELCRLWPGAEAVGLEPHRTARELGRSRIAAAGLADRVAVRDERLEMLGERDAYDVAFLPQPFLPREAIEHGLPRILEALRPGGWLIVLASEMPEDDPLVAAARRFRARVWGGGVIETAELEERLAGAGFAAARTNHPVASFRAICARKPPAEPAAGVDDRSRTGGPPAVVSDRITPESFKAVLERAARSYPSEMGIEPLEITDSYSLGRIVVDEQHLHPGGLVHGGAWCGLGDTVAAWQTFRHLPEGHNFTTIEMKLNAFAAAGPGDEILARAETLHGGRSTHVIEVRMRRAERLLANLLVTQFVLAPVVSESDQGS